MVVDGRAGYSRMHRELFGSPPGRAIIVHGGKLTREYLGDGRISRIVKTLEQAGRAIKFMDGHVDTEASRLTQQQSCTSDDEHVIALARVSHARLLCTQDKLLMQDFKNRNLISGPRGKVYAESNHTALLAAACTKKRKNRQ
jgi:hypothetical protein